MKVENEAPILNLNQGQVNRYIESKWSEHLQN